MSNSLVVYNTLSRKKETFVPIHPPFVSMYVCGPTVYGEPHLGHARPAIVFDLVFRYLKHLGFKVRYVRNITDVGHLENDADEGEDKIIKKAHLEKIEPMEVAQMYIDKYHFAMDKLNVQRPSIEPRASGHIIEQIEMIEKIIEKGYAYITNGSVYFDVPKFDKDFGYGKLSGRILDELIANSRELDGQSEKRNPADFALWKKAAPEHIMQWNSPWCKGFPGWHIECTAMSTKYLGEHFDIHGGGMDLLFPHHESEVCQSTIANDIESVKYWMHNNMITINGQKMGKSLGNFITLDEFFEGTHPNLQQAFSPMTIRFFILQAHYRSTLDFSNEALQAAEKGLNKLFETYRTLVDLKPTSNSTNEEVEKEITSLFQQSSNALNDDFNSPMVIANLFDASRIINTVKAGNQTISQENKNSCLHLFDTFLFDILGLKQSDDTKNQDNLENDLMQIILSLRSEAKNRKDYATADNIRNLLTDIGITIKDTKEGVEWSK